MKNQFKTFLRSKWGKMSLCCMALSSVLVGSCFAEETSSTIDTAAITASFTTGFTSIVTNSVAMLSAMLPIAIGLCGVLFVVKKGMTWFKAVAK